MSALFPTAHPGPRRLGLALFASLIALGDPTEAVLAAPPRPTRPLPSVRRPREAETSPARAPAPPAPPATPSDEAARSTQSPLAPPPARSGCDLRGLPRARFWRGAERLGAIDGADPVLWLELWPERASERLGASPTLRAEASHGGWLTLLWEGPDGHIMSPVNTFWLPGRRELPLSLPARLIAPAGRERIVAILTPQPHPVPCGDGRALERWLAALGQGPVAVAHAELDSLAVAPSATGRFAAQAAGGPFARRGARGSLD